MVNDETAEMLERKMLYRRAASRWLEVMESCCDDTTREWVKKRRAYCLEKALLPSPKADNFSSVAKAARETQRRMGIAMPNGGAFRIRMNRYN